MSGHDQADLARRTGLTQPASRASKPRRQSHAPDWAHGQLLLNTQLKHIRRACGYWSSSRCSPLPETARALRGCGLSSAPSSPSSGGIARAAKPLAARWPGGLIFRTAHCGENQDVFDWAYRVAESADDAKESMAAARQVAKGAYVKACDVAPRSLLALSVSAVDASPTSRPALLRTGHVA